MAKKARARSASTSAGARTPPSEEVWDELGGHRLLRVIGHGDRSTVYLAGGDGGHVVIKAFRPDAGRVCEEICALAAVDSPHVARIVDLSVVPGRPRCVVMERIHGCTLAEWLGGRSVIDGGEAVTAAVSLVRAVRSVHEAGWAHGAVSAANVRFAADGCPVLLGFGGVAPATPPGLLADWRACGEIVDALVGRIELPDAHGIEHVRQAMLRLCGEFGDERAQVADLESRLFELGPPAPVIPPSADRSGALRSRLGTEATNADAAPSPPESGEQSDGGGQPSRVRRAMPRLAHGAHALMEHGLGRELLPRLRALVVGRRRPLIVGAVAAAAIAAVGLLAVPSSPPGHPETSDRRASAPEALPARGDGRPQPHRSAGSVPRPSASDTAGPAPSEDEDPVTAAAGLLARRHACLVRRDGVCLAAVDEAGSPLLGTDMALIADGGAAAKVPDPPGRSLLSLVEALGEAAIIAVASNAAETTQPASVLMIRTEAGWRLRELFEN